MVLKYPSLETILKFESVESNNIDQLFNIVVDCIDYIYNSEEVFHAKEQTKSDLMDFLNNLSSDQFTSIQSFFETMPKLKKEITYKCPVCKTEHKKTLEGISSFF